MHAAMARPGRFGNQSGGGRPFVEFQPVCAIGLRLNGTFITRG
jgi:3-deoxy-D-manno-octulosonic acid (KDO) 8-phosphate synthase